MADFWTEFLTNPGYSIVKWPHYFPIYERHLSRFRGEPCCVLEIGCAAGGSLQLWKRSFGPRAQIAGIDILPACATRDFEPGIRVFTGDQGDVAFLAAVLEEIGTPDVIIDDGSHKSKDVIASFNFLFPRLSDRGVYVVEDLHAAYWPEFGGGLHADTFVEKSKELVDEMNAHHARGAVALTAFTETTRSMHFYDSMIVIEKGPRRVLPSMTSWGVDALEGSFK